jgi:hypothetical protein
MASSETEIKVQLTWDPKFASLKPSFEGSDQHETQEFLRFIIDLMREEVNKATKTNDRVIGIHTQNLGPILFWFRYLSEKSNQS